MQCGTYAASVTSPTKSHLHTKWSRDYIIARTKEASLKQAYSSTKLMPLYLLLRFISSIIYCHVFGDAGCSYRDAFCSERHHNRYEVFCTDRCHNRYDVVFVSRNDGQSLDINAISCLNFNILILTILAFIVYLTSSFSLRTDLDFGIFLFSFSCHRYFKKRHWLLCCRLRKFTKMQKSQDSVIWHRHI